MARILRGGMPSPGAVSRLGCPKHNSIKINSKIYLDSPLPPMALATLLTAINRPFKVMPMTVSAFLLSSAYLNVHGYATDAAGITFSWSMLYLFLSRKKASAKLAKKFGARGLITGAARGVAVANLVGCGVAYATGFKALDRTALLGNKPDDKE